MQEHDESIQELLLDNMERTKLLMHAAAAITDDEAAQVAALLTAATSIIETAVGPRRAGSVLRDFIAPTLAEWDRAGGATVQ